MTAAPPILWCAVCRIERVPLIEDGTCGWCGKSDWRAKRAGPRVQPSGAVYRRPHAPAGHGDRAVVRAAMDDVAARFGVTVAELRTYSRAEPIGRIRQIAMASARGAGASYPTIAAEFGRNHSTVIHAVRAVAERGDKVPMAPWRRAARPRLLVTMPYGRWPSAAQSLTGRSA